MDFDLSGHNGLRLWMQTFKHLVKRPDVDLTARQFTILLKIYLDEPPHTVRGIASSLNVTKPVVTRAIDSLSKLGLVKRVRDEQDKRNVFIQRTVKGAVYLTDLAELIEQANDEANNAETKQASQ